MLKGGGCGEGRGSAMEAECYKNSVAPWCASQHFANLAIYIMTLTWPLPLPKPPITTNNKSFLILCKNLITLTISALSTPSFFCPNAGNMHQNKQCNILHSTCNSGKQHAIYRAWSIKKYAYLNIFVAIFIFIKFIFFTRDLNYTPVSN